MIVNFKQTVRRRLKALLQEKFTLTRTSSNAYSFVGVHDEETVFLTPQAIFCVGSLGAFLLDRSKDEKDLRKSFFFEDERFAVSPNARGDLISFSDTVARQDVVSVIGMILDDSQRDAVTQIAHRVFEEGYDYFSVQKFVGDSMESVPEAGYVLFRAHVGYELKENYLKLLAIILLIANLSDSLPVGETSYYPKEAAKP